MNLGYTVCALVLFGAVYVAYKLPASGGGQGIHIRQGSGNNRMRFVRAICWLLFSSGALCLLWGLIARASVDGIEGPLPPPEVRDRMMRQYRISFTVGPSLIVLSGLGIVLIDRRKTRLPAPPL